MAELTNRSTREDNIYVIYGPKSPIPLSEELVGKEILNSLLHSPKNEVAMQSDLVPSRNVDFFVPPRPELLAVDAFTGNKLLYSQFLQKCINLAAALRTLGYHGQGTVITICSENCLDYFIPMFAALLNGSITAPVSHFYTVHELEHILKITTPNLVFCSEETLQKFVYLKQSKLTCIERIILLGDKSSNGVKCLEDFRKSVLKGRNVPPKSFRAAEGNARKTVALILTSSGTTGLPKAVALSHLCLNVRIAHAKQDFSRFSTFDNYIGIMPFFHSYGNLLTFSILLNGRTLVLLRRFNEDVFLRTIQDYKIKNVSISPPVALLLAKSEKVLKYDLSCVKTIRSGAAHLSKDLEEKLSKRFNGITTSQGYGLTEMTLTVTSVPPNTKKPGSCGKILSFISGKVRDPETGKSLGPNQVGELCWKGAPLMMGYYRDQQATEACFTEDGWFRSGDLGYYDKEGYFYIVDRLKELIKYKGFQVAPAELEAILINHPKIQDAAVVGLTDELAGELPLAFVVKQKGKILSAEEVQQYVRELVSPQKYLRGGVIFIDSIPKNPAGKIMRKELKKKLDKNINIHRAKL